MLPKYETFVVGFADCLFIEESNTGFAFRWSGSTISDPCYFYGLSPFRKMRHVVKETTIEVTISVAMDTSVKNFRSFGVPFWCLLVRRCFPSLPAP